MNTEGIVLRAVPYHDCHHIVTLFTPRGLIALFVRGSHRSRHFSHAVVTPLTRAEFILSSKPGSTLFSMHDVHVLDQHLSLRGDYPSLAAGCEMATTLLKTQMENKAAPKLYALFAAALKRLGPANATSLSTAFSLKLLKYEGLSSWHEVCGRCGEPLTAAALLENEAYCPQHAPPGAPLFTGEERATLLRLSATQKWEEIEICPVPEALKEKVGKLFASLTD